MPVQKTEPPLPPLQELIAIADVPDHLPRRKGRKIHRSAVYRWATGGLDGIKLRTVLVGSQLFTHPDWLAGFCAAVTESRRG